MNLEAMKARLSAIADEMDTLINASEDISAEDQAALDKLVAESEELTAKVEKAEKVAQAQAKARTVADAPLPTMPRKVPSQAVSDGGGDFVLPAQVASTKNLKAFKNDPKTAYAFGQWMRAALGSVPARQWCQDHGYKLATAHNEGSNTQGGYLVPIQFENSIIDLRNEYGVFRRYARVRPMSGDTLIIPRRSGGLTAYFTGESDASTESNKTWDQVQLVAKKLTCLARMSNEIAEDAIISVADDLASEIAYAFANKEDECGFNGDGTSTYGGITGVREKLKTTVNATTASAGGIVVGAGNAYSELILGDFTETAGLLPTYARRNARWYMSPILFHTYVTDLLYDAGGNTAASLQAGVSQQFLGYPVELVEVMPSTAANSQVCALFGDLSLACSFGDRRQTTLAFSDSATVNGENVFERDQIAVRGTERFDINVHDVGTSTTAGPIVGLQTLNA